MLCRYDTMALKSLDVFSIHGFPVAMCRWSRISSASATEMDFRLGSGGWINIIEKYTKAKRYCTEPFEVVFSGKKKTTHYISDEWIGEKTPQARRCSGARD